MSLLFLSYFQPLPCNVRDGFFFWVVEHPTDTADFTAERESAKLEKLSRVSILNMLQPAHLEVIVNPRSKALECIQSRFLKFQKSFFQSNNLFPKILNYLHNSNIWFILDFATVDCDAEKQHSLAFSLIWCPKFRTCVNCWNFLVNYLAIGTKQLVQRGIWSDRICRNKVVFT